MPMTSLFAPLGARLAMDIDLAESLALVRETRRSYVEPTMFVPGGCGQESQPDSGSGSLSGTGSGNPSTGPSGSGSCGSSASGVIVPSSRTRMPVKVASSNRASPVKGRMPAVERSAEAGVFKRCG